MILDEATSAIDVQGEKIVQQALDRVSKDRTTITIAHRLSTIRKADHIIVLRNGTKIEEGTHEQLLSIEDGLYSGLVQAQALTKGTLGDEEPFRDLGPTLSRQVTDAEVVKSLRDMRAPEEAEQEVLETYHQKSFFKTVGLLLYEQRSHWVWYVLTLFAAMAAGCKSLRLSFFTCPSLDIRADKRFLMNSGLCTSVVVLREASTGLRLYRPATQGRAEFLGSDVLRSRIGGVFSLLRAWLCHSKSLNGE